MSTGTLDPLIHHPERLRVVATLAALPRGDALSVTRLQTMTGIPASGLAAHLSDLDHAGYLRPQQRDGGGAPVTVALTPGGQAALARYAAALRQPPAPQPPPPPHARASDTDREATAAALAEHFAHGRLTLDELRARLDATLTAETYADLAQATRDLPHLG